jgi:hypothetical protein
MSDEEPIKKAGRFRTVAKAVGATLGAILIGLLWVVRKAART